MTARFRYAFRLFAAVCVATLATASSVSAATISVSPNAAAVAVTPGNDYVGVSSTPPGGTTVHDYWYFDVNSGAVATVANTLVNHQFVSLDVRWVQITGSGPSAVSALTPYLDVNHVGMTTSLALALAAGNYALEYMGVTGSGPTNGNYRMTLTVAETPLPPALLLFGSALAGLGFLRRNKRTAAEAA